MLSWRTGGVITVPFNIFWMLLDIHESTLAFGILWCDVLQRNRKSNFKTWFYDYVAKGETNLHNAIPFHHPCIVIVKEHFEKVSCFRYLRNAIHCA